MGHLLAQLLSLPGNVEDDWNSCFVSAWRVRAQVRQRVETERVVLKCQSIDWTADRSRDDHAG
jgi:hypothetical protein